LFRQVMALPSFSDQGGPFHQIRGRILEGSREIDLMTLEPSERATLAALYTAQVTAWLIVHLSAVSPIIVEGPFANNAIYAGILAALLPAYEIRINRDALEGTARGAWMLTRWGREYIDVSQDALLSPRVAALNAHGLLRAHALWLNHQQLTHTNNSTVSQKNITKI
jgi:hypothetical protein